MADPIRPSNWPALPAAPQRADPRTAAQRAFFEIALGHAAPEARPEAAPRAPSAAADLRIQLPSEPPQKILRPGSIIDIRV